MVFFASGHSLERAHMDAVDMLQTAVDKQVI
jgi:hypothetical protein